ncbi:MAG TPA: PPC domain-containing protein [Terriglobia bacterium]|nr:PPC domain-containing protein [Terriglobia bacterium]
MKLQTGTRTNGNTLVTLCATMSLSILAFPAALSGADEPIIPPTLSRIWPVGMERGTARTFTVEGRNLEGTSAVLFDSPGLSAKVLNVNELPGATVSMDKFAAAVPLGHQYSATIEVTAAKDVEAGVHWLRFDTPRGTSSTAVLDIGSLPEIEAKPASGLPAADSAYRDSTIASEPQQVTLPATLVGTIAKPGEVHTFTFEGKSGQELVFQAVGAELGSDLKAELVLRDSSGKVLARAGEYSPGPDAVLTVKLPADGPADGRYAISIMDRERGGGMNHYYRLNAGELPYVTGVFPLGVRAGQPSVVTVQGVNLGGVHDVTVDPPKSAPGWTPTWTTMSLPLTAARGDAGLKRGATPEDAGLKPAAAPLDKIELAVGNEPEIVEQEPNDTPALAQRVTVPVTINGTISGHIDDASKPGSGSGVSSGSGSGDEDYFRFTARQGEAMTIEVAAARLGSPLDSVIEVLDGEGHPIPRATLRCLTQTQMTLSDRDSRSRGFRLLSLSGLQPYDYLMIGDELVRLESIPDQPDADVTVVGTSGRRIAYLGTSPEAHAVETPVYKVEIEKPEAQFPPNGLPVFHLALRNDDGGPGYGADSRLDFTAPRDGEYLLHLKDARGFQGPDFAYRVTIRDARPDFTLSASPGNPNVPQGGRIPVYVEANRTLGYEGPIELEAQGLPKGMSAGRATIPAGQDSAVMIFSAAPDAAPARVSTAAPASISIVGRATINGNEVARVANADERLRVASVIPPPDVVVSADPVEVALDPGKETTVTLHVQRQNGFKGRVPCNVDNLPPGVRVVNVGLNGVLVTEDQTSRTFTLRAEDWAQPIEQPVYVVAEVESGSSTLHASSPLMLRVRSRRDPGVHPAEGGGAAQ